MGNAQLVLWIMAEVGAELHRAMKAFPPMASAHEGSAVIREEFEELWDEVKRKQAIHDFGAMKKEATQVAAMAMRFIHDVCERQNER